MSEKCQKRTLATGSGRGRNLKADDLAVDYPVRGISEFDQHAVRSR